MERFIIHRDETGDRFYGFPDIARTVSGKLIAVFLETTSHVNRDRSRICLKESRDNGETWENFRYLTEPGTANAAFNCPRVTRLSDGSLIILCDFNSQDVDENGNPVGVIHCRLWMWRGDAEGASFAEPELLPMHGMVPDRLRELSSGRWLVTAHVDYGKNGRPLAVFASHSDDRGKTWSNAVPIAKDPELQLCECCVCEYKPGRLIALLRENSGRGLGAYKVFSDNEGESWYGLMETPLVACHRPVIDRLSDGRFLVTYRLRPGGGRSGNTITLGAFLPVETLEAERRMDCTVRLFPLEYDRNRSPDNGYTGFVELDDGVVYVINYVKDDLPKCQIRGYRFHPSEWIL